MEERNVQDSKVADEETLVLAQDDSQSRKRKGKGKLRLEVDDILKQDHVHGSYMSLRVRQPGEDSRAGISQTCPVCGSLVSPSEMQHHCNVELERLRQMTESRFGASSHKKKRRKDSASGSQDASHQSQEEGCPVTDTVSDLIDKVKRNRHRRHIRGSLLSSSLSQVVACPVCGQPLHGNSDSVASHVDECLATRSLQSHLPDGSGSDSESFEEYTWAGQTRVRASTMVEGGLAATGIVSTLSADNATEDVELDVEGEGYALGKPQYTEADLIPCEADEPKEEMERQALRGAVLSMLQTVPSRMAIDESSGSIPDMTLVSALEPSVPAYAEKSTERLVTLLETLKAQIAEQEKQLQSQTVRCLICMEPYQKPVVSITCWHVYCERCWLQSLGMKKLCPQCNAITSPGDLRRIFL